MRSIRSLVLLSALAWIAAGFSPGAARAQGPSDHWLTRDSVTAALGLTQSQQSAIAVHYDSLNATLSRAIALRAAWRTHAGHQATVQQRDQYLNGVAQARVTVTSEWAALRALLQPSQQAKLDALPRPQIDNVGPRTTH